jgi:hypothetical protein
VIGYGFHDAMETISDNTASFLRNVVLGLFSVEICRFLFERIEWANHKVEDDVENEVNDGEEQNLEGFISPALSVEHQHNTRRSRFASADMGPYDIKRTTGALGSAHTPSIHINVVGKGETKKTQRRNSKPKNEILFSCQVLFPYKPCSHDELELVAGTFLDVVEANDPHWWKAMLSNGDVLSFPRNFVKRVIKEEPPPIPRRTDQSRNLRHNWDPHIKKDLRNRKINNASGEIRPGSNTPSAATRSSNSEISRIRYRQKRNRSTRTCCCGCCRRDCCWRRGTICSVCFGGDLIWTAFFVMTFVELVCSSLRFSLSKRTFQEEINWNTLHNLSLLIQTGIHVVFGIWLFVRLNTDEILDNLYQKVC